MQVMLATLVTEEHFFTITLMPILTLSFKLAKPNCHLYAPTNTLHFHPHLYVLIAYLHPHPHICILILYPFTPSLQVQDRNTFYYSFYPQLVPNAKQVCASP